MIVTAIQGIRGVWSYHRVGQPIVEGTGVYRYTHHWECEQHGVWRSWLPGAKLPCEEIAAVLASVGQPTPDYFEVAKTITRTTYGNLWGEKA